jgi:hypothetical protein
MRLLAIAMLLGGCGSGKTPEPPSSLNEQSIGTLSFNGRAAVSLVGEGMEGGTSGCLGLLSTADRELWFTMDTGIERPVGSFPAAGGPYSIGVENSSEGWVPTSGTITIAVSSPARLAGVTDFVGVCGDPVIGPYCPPNSQPIQAHVEFDFVSDFCPRM